MYHKHLSSVLTLILSLTVITGLGFSSTALGGDNCLVLHLVVVEGPDLDSPRASDREKGEYMMTQDFCLSEKYNNAELTGRALIGMHDKRGWGMATTMSLMPNSSGFSPEERCEAIWNLGISGNFPQNPGKYGIRAAIYVLDFNLDRTIAEGHEYSFDQLVELDKEFLIPIGPMGEFEFVSLAGKLTKDDSE